MYCLVIIRRANSEMLNIYLNMDQISQCIVHCRTILQVKGAVSHKHIILQAK